MNTRCIGVRSVTYAQKAKSLLDGRGIRSRIVRNNHNTTQGCGWCIAVPRHQSEAALSLLRELGVKLTGEFYDLP